MGRYGRSADETRLEIAYALGQGEDPIAYLRRQHEARWRVEDDDGR